MSDLPKKAPKGRAGNNLAHHWHFLLEKFKACRAASQKKASQPSLAPP
jgi:hypothetical protein